MTRNASPSLVSLSSAALRRLVTAFVALAFMLPLGAARTALAEDTGTTYAVLVGMADYPGEINDLPGTDEDARRIGRALSSNIAATQLDMTLLTNADATRHGVRAALQRVGRLAGSDDRVVFFYSGHGGSPAGDEPDGHDESISLYDGDMIDDELSALFDHVNAGLTLVAFDNCFSGGMYADLLDRPNTMGLFSSDEDVTSGWPDGRAGGWLSLFLAEALEGGADGIIEGRARQARDGQITALELEAYIRDRAAEHRRLPASDGDRAAVGLQFIITKRSAVAPYAVIAPTGAAVAAAPSDQAGPTRLQQLLGDAPAEAPANGAVVFASNPGETLGEATRHFGDFTLEAGRTYVIETFDLVGGADTVMQLRRSSGPTPLDSDEVVARDDDGGVGYASRVEVTPTETGAFYASIEAYQGRTGQFSFRVVAR